MYVHVSSCMHGYFKNQADSVAIICYMTVVCSPHRIKEYGRCCRCVLYLMCAKAYVCL